MCPTSPRISVVLPVYNALPTLARAFESLDRQTFTDWEVIAIDDGSNDGSTEWLIDRARRDPRVHWLRRPHEGLVAALNAGLKLARGEWVARLDADDECTPDRFAAQLEFADQNPSLGLIGSLVEFAGDKVAEAGYAAHVDWLNSLVSAEDIQIARFIESPFAHPSVLFRRRLVQDHGGYRSGGFPEDYELWLRWLEAGVRMAKVPRTLLRWHDSPGRLSRTDPRYSLESFFQLKAGFLARWLAHRPDGAARPLLIWGAGRLTRRRVAFLEAKGVQVSGFIDIDPRKQGQRPDGRTVHAPESMPPSERCFVVGYVTNRGARDYQRKILIQKGFVEGTDFLFAA